MSTAKVKELAAKYNSAIGTHRLSPRPLKNILYPYYRNYKPVYRARNSRTPLYYWPEIDKYPWHSHQKRFPDLDTINMDFFSEFVNREANIKTLFETLHPLPKHGINCIVWKLAKGTKKEAKRMVNIDGVYYIIDTDIYNNIYYHVKNVQYRDDVKEICLSVLHSLKGARFLLPSLTNSTHFITFLLDKLIKCDVSPVGSIRGVWRYSYPYKLEEEIDVSDQNSLGKLKFKTIDPYLYRTIPIPG